MLNIFLPLGILMKGLSLHTMRMSWVFCLDCGRFAVILTFLQTRCLPVVPQVSRCDLFTLLYLLGIFKSESEIFHMAYSVLFVSNGHCFYNRTQVEYTHKFLPVKWNNNDIFQDFQ